MFIDSHCHLDFPDFQTDLDQVLADAKTSGVGLMLTIGTKLRQIAPVIALADAHPQVWCTVGVHPHEAGAEEGGCTLQRLLELSAHPKVVGFGETGLDFFYDHSPRDAQERLLRIHCQAARHAGLPLVVHTRDADADIRRILADEMANGVFTGLIHCFSSGLQLAEFAIEIGFFVSFSGILTFKKAEALQDVARQVPLDRILIETDSPYLAPMPFRGKRNQPAYVPRVAAKLAELKGLPIAEVERQTTANFHRLFTKVAA
ncbi:putative metallodependent hydrolase [Rhodospirillaceae bacterium LM-1]|nr:putative metallodependent hydrolase [Rhodospirillaceae bacterium LM-1]